ncbi:hypothetical protein COV18_01560 [Candidatus Woesearchaeota archaeon CG10_big_fil_rev_8_21_14_0_10_37_12]|nr:MAG: hypothetical protein COV18_01560 [Candidatus Woesearchaeota archaeon CG10_big_fil_rev_8_21_14_0_10_37_12]
MKVILYMAISANGYVAKEDDDTSWISKTEWDSYSAAVRNAGALIVGRRTYNILTKQPEFSEFEKVKIAVVSKGDFETLQPYHMLAKTPKEALNLLSEFDHVIVAGGGILNASFIKENIVDEIYLDIEPTLFGKGIKLFADADFEAKLKLLNMNKLSDDEVQLHYGVIK